MQPRSITIPTLCATVAACLLPAACGDGRRAGNVPATAGGEKDVGIASEPAGVIVLGDSAFGTVAVHADTACLTASAARVVPRTITVVLPDTRQALSAKVVEAMAACPGQLPAAGERYFRLEAPGLEAGSTGIAILAAPVTVLAGARTDLDVDGVPESYRMCTSSEGVHLTVWAGEPVAGRRIWHSYYYLGYDVEPTCTDDEVASAFW